MRFPSGAIPAFATSLVLSGCGDLISSPNESAPSPGTALSASLTPSRNLEIILRGEGFGLVKFRQPKDDAVLIELDTWVRDLTPNRSYELQRATDLVVDDNCTSTAPEAWLTLGQGLTPRAITTDEKGTGREALFRILPPTLLGTAFDIHFRVIDQLTREVVLESECYQFVVSL